MYQLAFALSESVEVAVDCIVTKRENVTPSQRVDEFGPGPGANEEATKIILSRGCYDGNSDAASVVLF